MPTKIGLDLRADAKRDLKAIGYRSTDRQVKARTPSCEYYETCGTTKKVLLQCRSAQENSNRFLVGIMVNHLDSVDECVIWLENSTPRMYIFPASQIKEWLDNHSSMGEVNIQNNQWLVDIDADKNTFSPSRSFGTKYDILRYAQFVDED